MCPRKCVWFSSSIVINPYVTDKQCKRLRKRLEEWDERIQNLIVEDSKITQETITSWKKNEELLRDRQKQTLKWQKLREEIEVSFRQLLKLRGECDDVTEEDIQKIINEMAQVQLCINDSIKAQGYLKKLGNHLKNLERQEEDIRQYIDSIKSDIQLLASESKKDDMFKGELQECQAKFQEFNEMCSQSLLNISEQCEICTKEIESIKQTLFRIQR